MFACLVEHSQNKLLTIQVFTVFPTQKKKMWFHGQEPMEVSGRRQSWLTGNVGGVLYMQMITGWTQAHTSTS